MALVDALKNFYNAENPSLFVIPELRKPHSFSIEPFSTNRLSLGPNNTMTKDSLLQNFSGANLNTQRTVAQGILDKFKPYISSQYSSQRASDAQIDAYYGLQDAIANPNGGDNTAQDSAGDGGDPNAVAAGNIITTPNATEGAAVGLTVKKRRPGGSSLLAPVDESQGKSLLGE